MGRQSTATGVAFALMTLVAIAPAHAQERSEWRLRTSAAGGVVASGDQWSVFLFDMPVLEGDVRAGWMPHSLVALEARLNGGVFLSEDSSAGGLIDLTVGAELGGDLGVGRAYVALHFGAGLTGTLVRPILRASLGLDLHATDEIDLGPVLAYGHLFQEDGENRSDDAQWLTLGISLTFSPVSREPEPDPPVRRPPPPPPAPPMTPPPPMPAPPADDAEILMMIEQAVGIEPRELVVPILFQFDSTEMVACSIASLHSLAEHLEEHPEIELLEIEGHADGSGADEYNRELSERRAAAVRDWLVEHDVEAERLQVAARGEDTPIESNEEEAGREQNRRVRFRVLRETDR